MAKANSIIELVKASAPVKRGTKTWFQLLSAEKRKQYEALRCAYHRHELGEHGASSLYRLCVQELGLTVKYKAFADWLGPLAIED